MCFVTYTLLSHRCCVRDRVTKMASIMVTAIKYQHSIVNINLDWSWDTFHSRQNQFSLIISETCSPSTPPTIQTHVIYGFYKFMTAGANTSRPPYYSKPLFLKCIQHCFVPASSPLPTVCLPPYEKLGSIQHLLWWLCGCGAGALRRS